MAKSVKLKDGSYIDTEGVYDATLGKKQSVLNANISGIFAVTKRNTSNDAATYTVSFTWHSPALLIIDNNGRTNAYIINSISGITTLVESITGDYSPTKANDAFKLTFKVSPWGIATVISGGENIPVITQES